MPVGDVNSNEKGSGARYNDGKVPYDLLPLATVVNAFSLRYHRQADDDFLAALSQRSPSRVAVADVLRELSQFQRTGNIDHIYGALNFSTFTYGSISALAPAVRVFEYGAKKYAAWNWAKGMKWSVPLACAVRHCIAILSGELIDQESGQPHMGHVQCNLLMLATYVNTYPEGNDLPVGLV